MNVIFNPPHPGETVVEIIHALGLSITSAAQTLGVTRKTLSALVNGRAGISADMAVRLSRVFGSSSGFWLRLQANYDLWHAEQRMKDWVPEYRYTDVDVQAAGVAEEE